MMICSRCKLEKRCDEFYSSKTSKSGYRSKCKACDKELASAWNKKNPERRSTSSMRYYESHKDVVQEKNRKRSKTWYANNRERKLLKNKEWNTTHKEQRDSFLSKWRRGAKEVLRRKIYGLAWFRNNPDKRKSYSIKRRTAKANNGGSFTDKEWAMLKDFYGNICLCCKEEKELTADHIVPLKLGGTSFINNIQPLCQSCNSRKHLNVVDYRNGIIPNWITS